MINNLDDLNELNNDIEIILNFTGCIKRLEPLLEINHSVDSLTWCSEKNISHLNKVYNTTLIVPINIDRNVLKKSCNYILTSNPRYLFSMIIKKYFMDKVESNYVSKSAIIHKDTKIGCNVYIGENVVIESGCKFGDNVRIDHNTVIKRNTILGNDVSIGCNCVIGGNGCGYEKNANDLYEKIPHIGNVVLHDCVDIGQNNCIDRAVLGSTVIDFNVKTGNHVHIAHGVSIGCNSILTAHTMVAGSVKIGKNVWVGPSTSFMNGIKIGDNSFMGLGAVVIKSVKEGSVVAGNPALEIKKL